MLLLSILPILWLAMTEHGYLVDPTLEHGVCSQEVIPIALTLINPILYPTLPLPLPLPLTRSLPLPPLSQGRRTGAGSTTEGPQSKGLPEGGAASLQAQPQPLPLPGAQGRGMVRGRVTVWLCLQFGSQLW